MQVENKKLKCYNSCNLFTGKHEKQSAERNHNEKIRDRTTDTKTMV